jgi:hypothetical protein
MASSGSNTGGGANTLCMPKIPEYLEFTATNDASSSELRRAEYETGASTIPSVFAALNNYEGEQEARFILPLVFFGMMISCEDMRKWM